MTGSCVGATGFLLFDLRVDKARALKEDGESNVDIVSVAVIAAV